MTVFLEALLYVIIGWAVSTIAFKVFDFNTRDEDAALLFGAMMLLWWAIAAILIFYGIAKLGLHLAECATDKAAEKYESVTKHISEKLRKMIEEQQKGEKR